MPGRGAVLQHDALKNLGRAIGMLPAVQHPGSVTGADCACHFCYNLYNYRIVSVVMKQQKGYPKMKLTHGLAAVALTFSAMAAHAEITGTVTVVSDYDFRGITQTAQDPALQGSLDYAHESGFYIGAWASNVDFGDCCDEEVEVDYYTGFRGGEDITFDVGLIYYSYPGAEGIDFPEVYASLGYKWISGKIWYSDGFGGTDDSAMYYEANGAWELPANFGLTAHLGYSDGDYWSGSEYSRLLDRRHLRDQPFHAGPEVGRRQRPGGARRHAGRRQQQRSSRDFLGVDHVSVEQRIIRLRRA